MSVAVGLVEDGKVWIGTDSALADASSCTPHLNTKLFKKGEVLIGMTGCARSFDVIAHMFRAPAHTAHMSVDRYMRAAFVPELRQSTIDLKYSEDHKEGVNGHDFRVLVGYQGRLFQINGWFAVLETSYGFDSIGSGSLFSLGVLHDLRNSDWGASNQIRRAMEAAEFFDPYVKRPFHIKSI